MIQRTEILPKMNPKFKIRQTKQVNKIKDKADFL